MIKLRKATIEDQYDMWVVRAQAIRAISSDFYRKEDMEKWAPEDMPESFGEMIRNHDWWIIEVDAEVVGTGFLDQKNLSLEAIFVKPAHQGKGYAKRIVEKLEEEARSKGFTKVTLEATLNAAAFYEKCGFSVRENSKYHSPRGIVLDCVKMEKKL